MLNLSSQRKVREREGKSWFKAGGCGRAPAVGAGVLQQPCSITTRLFHTAADIAKMILATNPATIPYTMQLSDLDGDSRVNRSTCDRRCTGVIEA